MATTKFKFALIFALNLACTGSATSRGVSQNVKASDLHATRAAPSQEIAYDTTTAPATSSTLAPADGEAIERATTSSASALVVPDIPGADPAINRPWQDDELQPMVNRLEHESREIYRHHQVLIDALPVKSGMVIADLGAGSGLLTLPLARKVGQTGRVFALDINPVLLAKINRRASSLGLRNVETRLTSQTSVNLAPASIDAVVICDTYHHFETPSAVLRDLQSALRPNGAFFLIDLAKIKGVTSSFLYDHVRAGKEVFRQEIESAGFDFVREIEVAPLVENYVLEFRKR